MSTARRKPTKKPRSVNVPMRSLGRAVAITYKHAGTGKTHRHDFGRAVKIGYAANRRGSTFLIIGPVQVNQFIEG